VKYSRIQTKNNCDLILNLTERKVVMGHVRGNNSVERVWSSQSMLRDNDVNSSSTSSGGSWNQAVGGSSSNSSFGRSWNQAMNGSIGDRNNNYSSDNRNNNGRGGGGTVDNIWSNL